MNVVVWIINSGKQVEWTTLINHTSPDNIVEQFKYFWRARPEKQIIIHFDSYFFFSLSSSDQ